MKRETIAIHGGYDVDPTTKAVAVPIYQTVAYAFDSADHGAALFNLEVEGYRYTRIANPTTAVLERRVAALEGGLEALCVSSGQAAVHYAVLNVTGMGTNIVSVPAALRHDSHAVRAPAAQSGRHRPLRRVGSSRGDRQADRRPDAGDLLRKRGQSGGQRVRHRGAGAAWPTSAAFR